MSTQGPGMVRQAPRPRVVHVIDSLAGSGGAENRLVEEAVVLGDRFDQLVVRLFEDGCLDRQLVAAGIPVVALGFRARRAAHVWPLAVRRLRDALRSWRPDVVHTSLFMGNLVGQLAAARLGLPVLSTFNRTGDLARLREQRRAAGRWRGRALHALGARVARRSGAHYRAVGAHALETNCAAFGIPADRAWLVPRAVSAGPVEPIGRDRLGVPEGAPLFINVARLAPEKAQHLLVAAFAAARTELPGAHLVIVGPPGPNGPAVRAAIARHGVAGVVQLPGFRPDARRIVAAADVFAFSSLCEGAPGSVAEALCLGTPVAAFDIAPVRELTDDGVHAWLAPAGSVDALAERMVAAQSAPDRAARVQAAQAWAVARYRLDLVADQLGDLLAARAGRPCSGTVGGVR